MARDWVRARAAAWRTDWREGSVTRGVEAVILVVWFGWWKMVVAKCMVFALVGDRIEAAMAIVRALGLIHASVAWLWLLHGSSPFGRRTGERVPVSVSLREELRVAL